MKSKFILLATTIIVALGVAGCNEDDSEVKKTTKSFDFTEGIASYTETAGSDIAEYVVTLRKGDFDESNNPSGETASLTVTFYAGLAQDPQNPILPAGTYSNSETSGTGKFNIKKVSLIETDASGKPTKTTFTGGEFIKVELSGNQYTINAGMSNASVEATFDFSGEIVVTEINIPENIRLEAIYFGNNLLTFTGGFTLDFYYYAEVNGVNSRIGTQVMAYMPLADDLDNVKLKPGVYTVEEPGIGEEPGKGFVNTFEKGHFGAIGMTGSYSYLEQGTDFFPQKSVTGGTFEIKDLGNGTYKFIIDFTTIEYYTGEVSDNITFEYTGKIDLQVSAEEYLTLENITMSYYGDEKQNGLGLIKGDIYDFAGTSRLGLKLQGFMPLLSNPETGELVAGTYTIAEIPAERTLVEATRIDTTLEGTYFYYYDPTGILMEKAVMINAGTITVERNGTDYTIKTNLSGYDPIRQVDVTGVNLKFEGSVLLQNRVPGDQVNYNFTFNRARYNLLDNTEQYTNIEINLIFEDTANSMVYTLGLDVNIQPVSDVDNIQIPLTTFTSGTGINNFKPGWYNEETQLTYRSGVFIYNSADKTYDRLLIEGGTAKFEAGTGESNYKVTVDLTGTLFSSNSPITLKGTFEGEIKRFK